ncbi:MAG TPA: hypothetical protein VL242_04585 [Sorangium sp.]|nr:hypothetical protein [Sorangium sp.]
MNAAAPGSRAECTECKSFANAARAGLQRGDVGAVRATEAALNG